MTNEEEIAQKLVDFGLAVAKSIKNGQVDEESFGSTVTPIINFINDLIHRKQAETVREILGRVAIMMENAQRYENKNGYTEFVGGRIEAFNEVSDEIQAIKEEYKIK